MLLTLGTRGTLPYMLLPCGVRRSKSFLLTKLYRRSLKTMAESEVYPSKQGDSKEILVNSLDDLLERYLHLLNQYQTIQHKLTQLFSRVWIVSAVLD